jgi:hypothetical protein
MAELAEIHGRGRPPRLDRPVRMSRHDLPLLSLAGRDVHGEEAAGA